MSWVKGYTRESGNTRTLNGAGGAASGALVGVGAAIAETYVDDRTQAFIGDENLDVRSILTFADGHVTAADQLTIDADANTEALAAALSGESDGTSDSGANGFDPAVDVFATVDQVIDVPIQIGAGVSAAAGRRCITACTSSLSSASGTTGGR